MSRSPMMLVTLLRVAAVLLGVAPAYAAVPARDAPAPVYAPDGRMERPDAYREWVYLSTGIDMSYSEGAMAGHSMFDSVFVNPAAYAAFLRDGTWPEQTVLVLELRAAVGKGSINRAGKYQSGEPMGLEVHVKDSKRYKGGWAFFSFDDGRYANAVPTDRDCYACHAEHAAVDTTFVQFSPTLLGLAIQKGTLSAGYRRDEAAALH